MIQVAAYIYTFFIAIIFFFHIGLIMGQPWGKITMGGQESGTLSKKKRIAAFAALFLLLFFLLNILSQSDLMFEEWKNLTSKTIWIVVFFNFISLIGNFITKSKWERLIWAPVATIMFTCIVIIVI